MTEDPNPKRLRADAVRNRARILAAARECFAAHGSDVPLDEIARHAGVGPGTLHRHFPTKEALLTEVVVGSLSERVAQSRALGGADGLFVALDAVLDDALANRALKNALADAGIDVRTQAHEAIAELTAAMARLLRAAQRAGTARAGLGVGDVMAVLAGTLAAQDLRGQRVRPLLLECLRAAS